MVRKIYSDTYKINNKKYVKITRNNLLIFDALMNDGGHIPKYHDHKKNYKYSEHFGMLDICGKTVDKIIISNKTNRLDKFDNSILLPGDVQSALEYEYIFHTHPPSPNPGSRANDGILYEFPSINDIFHFLEHYNEGETVGSIIISPEGIYIIIPTTKEKPIKYEITNKLIKNMTKDVLHIQELAIEKYGLKFNLDTYFKNIAQDHTFLKLYNKLLEKYLGKKTIKILWKPRIYDEKIKEWVIPPFYLPIFGNK